MRGALLVLLITVAALASAATASAEVTSAQLAASGWTCFKDPVLPRVSCSDPGHGRPVLGAPADRPPSYNFMAFTLDGAFLGTIHLIRTDLYAGQPCHATGGSYTLIVPIGYYRCTHF